MKDRYGFVFWLKWIFSFAASFIVSAAAWTVILQGIFGAVRGAELTILWSICVFGSWFLAVIPFMRKKERIWKRLNDDQEKAVDAWLAGMAIFIGLLIASAFFWSWVWRARIAAGQNAAPDAQWLKSVFSTWLVVLIPFLVVLYQKADRIFKTAETRQAYIPRFQRAAVQETQRMLSPDWSRRLAELPQVLPGGQVVLVMLKDGRKVPHVFIYRHREIKGIYGVSTMDWSASDIVDIKAISKNSLPPYIEEKWLRVDITDTI